jgi:hypothetical protein
MQVLSMAPFPHRYAKPPPAPADLNSVLGQGAKDDDADDDDDDGDDDGDDAADAAEAADAAAAAAALAATADAAEALAAHVAATQPGWRQALGDAGRAAIGI